MCDGAIKEMALLSGLRYNTVRRSQWQRRLRRRSATARLLRLWVRIPSGTWMSVVSFVCCQIRVLCVELITRPEGPTDCGAPLCVI
jgi:hypothetical protein